MDIETFHRAKGPLHWGKHRAPGVRDLVIAHNFRGPVYMITVIKIAKETRAASAILKGHNVSAELGISRPWPAFQ